jgi:hypothetical protein
MKINKNGLSPIGDLLISKIKINKKWLISDKGSSEESININEIRIKTCRAESSI